MGNKVALSYLLKMGRWGEGGGGYAQSEAFKNWLVNLALSAVSWNHNCCSIFTKQVECPSRLEVLELQ